MTNSDKAKELQKCVKTILRYCESKKDCNENCIFYKNRYGCIINIPDNYNCDVFLIQKF